MATHVHTTYKGRVVYDRNIHYFTQKDLQRILRKLKEQEPTESETPGWFDWIRGLLEDLFDYCLGLITEALSIDDAPIEDIRLFLVRLCDKILVAVGFNPFFIEDYLKSLDKPKGTGV